MYVCYSKGKYDPYSCELIKQLQDISISFSYTEILQQELPKHISFKRQLEQEKYVVIVLTLGLLEDAQAMYELFYIYELFREKKVSVITLDNLNENIRLPERLRWLNMTDSLRISCVEELHGAVLFLLEKYLLGAAKEVPYSGVENAVEINNLFSDHFIIGMLDYYKKLEKADIRARITVVISIFQYIKNTYYSDSRAEFYYKCICYLSKHSDDNNLLARQIYIMEICLAAMLLYTSLYISRKNV